jgi:hypothetical protein
MNHFLRKEGILTPFVILSCFVPVLLCYSSLLFLKLLSHVLFLSLISCFYCFLSSTLIFYYIINNFDFDIFKFMHYPTSILHTFSSNIIGGIIDASYSFLTHLTVWFVFNVCVLMLMLLLSSLCFLSGSGYFDHKWKLLTRKPHKNLKQVFHGNCTKTDMKTNRIE